MRAIKFRAWDKEEKMMFYFDKEHSKSDGEGVPCLTNKKAHYLITYHELFDVEQKSLIPLEFTGLKDKNGKEIFEGDFLQGMGTHVLEVIKTKYGYGIKFRDGGKDITENFDDELFEENQVEVIGNIWENEDLLK